MSEEEKKEKNNEFTDNPGIALEKIVKKNVIAFFKSFEKKDKHTMTQKEEKK